jgi:hypothetical protein
MLHVYVQERRGDDQQLNRQPSGTRGRVKRGRSFDSREIPGVWVTAHRRKDKSQATLHGDDF